MRRPGIVIALVMAMVFAAAIVREINLLMLVGGMMAGPLLYSLAHCVLAFRRLNVKRRVAPRATAGAVLEVEIELANQRKRSSLLAITVRDQLERENYGQRGSPLEPSVWFPRIEPGQTRSAAYRCRLARRGRYRFGPLAVSTRFPFGLLERTRLLRQFDRITVWPRLGRLTQGWTRSQHEAYQASRQTARQHGFLEGDFHGLRDWRDGDSRRWIHWRTTARHGDLMVRQFEQQRNQDLAVLLELWRPTDADEAALESVELAVGFAATVVADRCRRGGCRLQLGVAAREIVLTGGPASMAFHHEAIECLAVAEATPGDRLPSVVPKVLHGVRRGATVLVISTRPVDLTDTDRFEQLWESPRLRTWATRAMCVDASSPELAQYFAVE